MSDTQNTPVVIGRALSTSIKSAHVRKLIQFSRQTGHSPAEVLNRAVDLFMNIEAPVYLAHAKQRQRQKA